LLPAELLEKILLTIKSRFTLAPNTEITLEINPESVTNSSAQAWRELGINRASLGVQSLENEELKRLKRIHTAEGARKAFRTLHEVGFANVSIDLMYGLEGQTVRGWLTTLEKAIAWQPEHLSAYNLTIEEKTRFAVEKKSGWLTLPDDGQQTEMFEAGRERLTNAGLFPYEISNYARPGFESRHNMTYWTGGNYWGVGVSAHSFQRAGDKIVRWWNPRSLRMYMSGIEQGIHQPEQEALSTEVHWGERLMTGLRLTSGVDLEEIAKDLEAKIPEQMAVSIRSFVASGHLKETGTRFQLTSRGVLFSSEIARAFV
jgi:oxygen-independent coproporphyrinogen-3 oxidase